MWCTTSNWVLKIGYLYVSMALYQEQWWFTCGFLGYLFFTPIFHILKKWREETFTVTSEFSGMNIELLSIHHVSVSQHPQSSHPSCHWPKCRLPLEFHVANSLLSPRSAAAEHHMQLVPRWISAMWTYFPCLDHPATKCVVQSPKKCQWCLLCSFIFLSQWRLQTL